MQRICLLLTLLLAACSATPQAELSPQAVTTVTTTVRASTDDAAESKDHWATPQNTRLPLSLNKAGVRFDVSGIPDGATVTDARIQFKAAALGSGSAVQTIRVQRDAPPFVEADNNITYRPTTAGSVSWTVPKWRAVGHRNADQLTPNLSAILNQALEGATTDDVAFIFSGSGSRTAYAYDAGVGFPSLAVTYTVADTPPPVEPDPEPEPEPTPDPSVSTPADFTAGELRESVGVGIHAPYNDTSYYDLPRVKSYLLDLGVPWIRDGIKEYPPTWYTDFFKSLAASGIRSSLIVGDPTGRDGQYSAGESAKLIQALKTTWAGGFHQLEGPDEWDISGRSGWQEELRRFYAEYRSAIRNEPSLNGVRFLGGSMAHASNFQSFTDYNQETETIHPYPGGEMPEAGFLPQHIAWAKGSAGAGKPVVATEMGYNNAVNTSTSGNIGVPEDVDAHYFIRELVYNYDLGVEQNFKYQLFDQKPNNPGRTNVEEWFGLVAVEGDPSASRTTWTLRKKPSFYALGRFLAYLKDEGTGGAPDTLPFEISAPANAVVVPIARRDGSYDVAVWLKNRLWDTATVSNPGGRYVIPDSSGTATLRFASPSSVDAYRPSVSPTVTSLATNVSELNVRVDGKVTFFRVKP